MYEIVRFYIITEHLFYQYRTYFYPHHKIRTFELYQSKK